MFRPDREQRRGPSVRTGCFVQEGAGMSTAEVEASSLSALARAEAACTRCPLYRDATQVVPGEGPDQARLMVVGEQPGDREDLAGRPFVGPAGRLFDAALAEAGIPRDAIFLTNAVKHFKFEQRGKRRLHKRPNAGEIRHCRWWLGQERKLVAPAVILAMGATAVQSLLGRAVSISSLRGRVGKLEDGTPMIATVHPSYLLRIRDSADREREHAAFVADLMRGWELAG
nr:UdgX family uracil-DNA binding protein [Sinirhodobacter populi]